MKTYWKDYQGDDENLWEHEWGKHGTCISTLEPKCYSNNDTQQGVVDYFEKTAELFEELSSYSVRIAYFVTNIFTRFTYAEFYSLVSVCCRNRPE